MMYYQLLAHAGEHHETVAEAAQHASQTGQGITFSWPAIFWVVLVVVPALIVLLSYVTKLKLSTLLLLLGVFLVGFSIISYQAPGAYSVIALVVGFSIVLLLTIATLSKTHDKLQ